MKVLRGMLFAELLGCALGAAAQGYPARPIAIVVAFSAGGPTLAESGYPGLEVASWYGILAPAGTPQDIVRKLNADINRILQAPDVRERLTALGTEPTGGTPEQFAATIKADTARWAKVMSDAGIRVE